MKKITFPLLCMITGFLFACVLGALPVEKEFINRFKVVFGEISKNESKTKLGICVKFDSITGETWYWTPEIEKWKEIK